MTTKPPTGRKRYTLPVRPDQTKHEDGYANLNLPVERIEKKKPGRQKGSKNKKTLAREARVAGFERQMLEYGHEIIQAVCEQAIDGCRQSQKMWLDRIVPVMKASDGEGNKSQNSFQITIGRLEDTPIAKRIQGQVIDQDPED